MTATARAGVLHTEAPDGGTEFDIFVFEPANALDTLTYPRNGQFLEWAEHYLDLDDIECDASAAVTTDVAAAVAKRFAVLGYCVYDGVNYFAIFEPGHCS